jgi:serine/threonine protein kinase
MGNTHSKQRRHLTKFYDVEEKIGRGTSGFVYHCTNKINSKKCAVKMIQKMSFLQINEIREEIRIMIMMKHDNIIKIYDVCY